MEPSVYLVFGNDEYRVASKAREVVNRLLPASDREFGLEIIEGNRENVDSALEAVGQCLQAMGTPNLFVKRPIVWFRDVSFLSETRTGDTDDVKNRVNDLASAIRDDPAADRILLITAPKVDKRYALYKACRKLGDVHEFNVPDKEYLAERAARDRLREALEKEDFSMESSACSAFLEKVGTDTRQIVNETEKLGVYLGSRRKATLDDVMRVTSSTRGAMVWDLADALGCRDLTRALTVIRQLTFLKTNPIAMVMAIQGRLRDLIVYREAMDRGWLVRRGNPGRQDTLQWGTVSPEAARLFESAFVKDPRATHPYRAGLLASQAARFSVSELKGGLKQAMAAHEQLVRTSVPDRLILEILVISLLNADRAHSNSGPEH